MQTSDGTPMTRRQYQALVRSQEGARATPEPRRAAPPALAPGTRTPRRRALLRSVPGLGRR